MQQLILDLLSFSYCILCRTVMRFKYQQLDFCHKYLKLFLHAFCAVLCKEVRFLFFYPMFMQCTLCFRIVSVFILMHNAVLDIVRRGCHQKNHFINFIIVCNLMTLFKALCIQVVL